MKANILLFLLGGAVTGLAQTTELKQPLIVQTSANWVVKYKGDKGIQFYTIDCIDKVLPVS
jgi:hypothetical protein